jgi:hypothetical protein
MRLPSKDGRKLIITPKAAALPAATARDCRRPSTAAAGRHCR